MSFDKLYYKCMPRRIHPDGVSDHLVTAKSDTTISQFCLTFDDQIRQLFGKRYGRRKAN